VCVPVCVCVCLCVCVSAGVVVARVSSRRAAWRGVVWCVQRRGSRLPMHDAPLGVTR
jgi:hypothetical protein